MQDIYQKLSEQYPDFYANRTPAPENKRKENGSQPNAHQVPLSPAHVAPKPDHKHQIVWQPNKLK